MIKKYKNIIIVVVIISGAFWAYNQFFNTEIPGSASLRVTSSTDVLGADIIKAINQINALKLDRSVFEDPIFRTLVDRSEEILPQAKSRPNPFAPITITDFTVSTSSDVNVEFSSVEVEEPEQIETDVADIPANL